jgi:hypothetical protein
MRITCDRCGKDSMLLETHTPQGGMLIRDIIKRMRHDGCGGLPGRAELLTGIEGASSRPVRSAAGGYGFAGPASPTLKTTAPTAASTCACRTRNMLGPVAGSERMPASNTPRT